MRESALYRLNALDLLALDSLVYIDEHADDHAEGGRDNGLDVAVGKADAHAVGLDTASAAPASAPVEPTLPEVPDAAASTGRPFAGSDLLGAADIVVTDRIALAKPEGTPGGGKGGGGSGDGGSDGTLKSYLSGQDTPNGFNIEIIFKGSWTTALQKSFIDVSELISNIVTGDIQDVFYRGKIIDDIRIDASLVDIDGSGGVLGQAGPTAYRTTNFLPATAIMEFDVADAEDFDAISMFNDIVFHEMTHSVGFGTMWDLMGLLGQDSTGGLRFTGTQATQEYNVEFSFLSDPYANAGVAVESDFGAGTRGGHWNDGRPDTNAGEVQDEMAGLDNEIMTGFINTTGNYLSDTTIAALDDMGYQTIYAANTDVGSALDMAIFEDHLVA